VRAELELCQLRRLALAPPRAAPNRPVPVQGGPERGPSRGAQEV
jgi:hypothetical protein